MPEKVTRYPVELTNRRGEPRQFPCRLDWPNPEDAYLRLKAGERFKLYEDGVFGVGVVLRTVFERVYGSTKENCYIVWYRLDDPEKAEQRFPLEWFRFWQDGSAEIRI